MKSNRTNRAINQFKACAAAVFVFAASVSVNISVSASAGNSTLTPTQNITPLELQSSTTINILSAQMLAAKMGKKASKNAMISSVSLYYALSVLELGAAGDSAQLLQSVLLADSIQEVEDVAPLLAENLVLAKNEDRPSLGSFLLANSIWSTNGGITGKPFVFSAQFQSDSADKYQASEQSLDFMADGASTALNDWADEKTNGLIPEIIDDRTLKEFVWVIMNAAYFEGAWGTSMRRIPENSGYLFKQLDGSEVQSGSIKTRDYKAPVLDMDDGSLAFSLPFAGRKYSFIAYVPAESEVSISEWLVDTGVAEMPNVIHKVLNNQSNIYQLGIQLPVFAYSDGLEMKKGSKVAEKLGLTALFGNQANFSLMVDTEKTAPSVQDTKVGIIKQNTRIELDEKGVKAAAVTLIGGISKTSVGPRYSRRNIVVDRPFVYAIIENSSRTMLFNGVLTQPGE